jgi:hypothetical protein
LNITTIHQEPPLAWAEKHFAEVDLGETRRNQRTVTIAAAMAANPDKSIPKMFIHGYDIKAAYNFFSHPEATPDNVQLAHRELVLEQMRLPGRYLLLYGDSGGRVKEASHVLFTHARRDVVWAGLALVREGSAAVMP